MNFESFGLLGKLSEAFDSISAFFSELWDTLFVQTVGGLLKEAGLFGSVASVVLPSQIYEASLGWLILGAGLSIYLAYQLITWMLNLIT